MCNWGTLLYSRKLTEHCKPVIIEKIKKIKKSLLKKDGTIKNKKYRKVEETYAVNTHLDSMISILLCLLYHITLLFISSYS